ncbi:hypothetical protein [Massilia pseudoviolaceinigra]|uniref:hypothetical protein n=1 Tax=Massilia pseudoviolaceinigra TaxID=3057165 RepID=UPI00279687B3|nr:hypothetical protein [Massilia sp. CCM 9206]MDQ1920893.1 hypothetical protein [Massilia sp. CCM 9206]
MSSAAFEILAIVETFEPVRVRTGRAGWELLFHRVTVYAFLISLGLGGIFLLFFGWDKFVSPLRGIPREVGAVFGLGVILSEVVILIALVAETLCSFIALRESLLRNFISDLKWDLAHSRRLDRFNKKDLKRAQEFVELRANRARERIKMFIGGTDKLALVVLLAGGWAVFKEVPWRASFFLADWADPAHLPSAVLFLLFVFAISMIAGAFILNVQVQRYAYQLEVLKLQLSTRD